MAIDDAAELASIFDDDEQAEACTYAAAAGGQPVALNAIVNREVDRRELGLVGIQAGAPEALLLASALPEGDPAEGDELAVPATGEVFTVRRARREAAGKLWRLTLKDAS